MSQQIIWEDGYGPCVGCAYEDETCCHYVTETGECDLDEGENNAPTTADTQN